MTKAVQILIPVDLHTKIKVQAAAKGITLKDAILKAIEDAVEKK